MMSPQLGDAEMTSSLEKIVIDWMSDKGAAEWHGVAVNWNWDNGLGPLLWIVDQEACDRATALELFWMCDPYYYMEEGHRLYDPRGEGHQLVHRILGNWGRYGMARFKFRLPWQVRYLESESYGLSRECLEALQPMLVETDGRERYPNYGPGGPAECVIAHKELSGEPATDLDRELLAQERAGENLSATDEEVAASHRRELEESLSELEDMLSTFEEYTREGAQSQGREEPPETPFGEEITSPDSRTMPPELHGRWVRDLTECRADSDERGSRSPTVISSNQIVMGKNIERVVAVRFIDAENHVLDSGLLVASPEVAVVTLPADEAEEQQYSLFYFGLSEDGDSLIDLKSMDWVLRRCPTRTD